MLAAEVGSGPVGVAQVVDAHAAARGMDEVFVAEVDAAVGGSRFIGGEKDEVAFGELACLDGLAELVLFVGCAGYADAVLGEDVFEVAGAVKAFFWGIAAEYVRYSHVAFCRGYYFLDFRAHQECLSVGNGGNVIPYFAIGSFFRAGVFGGSSAA